MITRKPKEGSFIMTVKKETIIRTVLLILGLINMILNSTGHSPLPFDDDQVTTVVSDVYMITVSLWAWWKNNSFTRAALQADEVLRRNRILMEKEDK